jgi:nondiscriminating glutamyl-tRNA synthetase
VPETAMRVRFAPSPTGPIHVGNAHTMLFNWLWCRHRGGTFVLRFEDTDPERSRPEWERVVVEEMRWLGLDWDEGPDVGGPYAPYRQTGRLDLYREHLELLKARGAVYPCYCTPAELESERRLAEQRKEPYRYSRRCLALSPADRAAKEAAGARPVWRLRVPDGETVEYEDLIRGPIAFQTDLIGDPVLVRASGAPLYNFAVVVDDVTMEITDVVRGEGHISNTPVQLLIYRALGAEPPRLAHVSHLLTPSRGKIAKRKGELSVGEFRERGVLPEALFNYLALLGWSPPAGSGELMSREEIVAPFDIRDVGRSAAVFDDEKLAWLNGAYLRRKTTEEFAELAAPFVVARGLATADGLRERWGWFVRFAALVQERVQLLGEVAEYAEPFFADELRRDQADVARFLTPAVDPFLDRVAAALGAVGWTHDEIETTIRDLIAELGLPTRAALQALRVAVSGRSVSPPLFEMIELVGRERSIDRVRGRLGHP